MADGLRVSVALCTCNGERFITAQLESISAQTRLPDEVIICDDSSTEATLELVANFSENAPFSVSYYKNPQRLGVAKNFERAISTCTGDIILLCDQDDIWLPEKVATIIPQFQADERVGLVFSNGFVTDSALNKLGYTVWESFSLDEKARAALMGTEPLAFLIRHYAITGATMAFRATLKDRVLPIPKEWIHDAWIACLAARHGSIVAVDTPLILYRQHENNVVGGRKLSLFGRFRRMKSITPAEISLEISRWRILLDKLEAGGAPGLASTVGELRSKISHLKAREAVFYAGMGVRGCIVMRELLGNRYSRFSKGFSSAFTDLFLRQRVSR